MYLSRSASYSREVFIINFSLNFIMPDFAYLVRVSIFLPPRTHRMVHADSSVMFAKKSLRMFSSKLSLSTERFDLMEALLSLRELDACCI
jgi:hypothetical protein